MKQAYLKDKTKATENDMENKIHQPTSKFLNMESKKKRAGIAVISVCLILLCWIIFGKHKTDANLIVPVKNGEFLIEVTATGQLKAEEFQRISIPDGLRFLGIYNVKIADLIPEGTVVDSGQHVASLDKTAILEKLKTFQDQLQITESKVKSAQLDTAITLRGLREEINNFNFTMEEKNIAVDQSKFEPPATQRQAVLDLEKTKRQFEQLKRNYILKTQQALTQMTQVNFDFQSALNEIEKRQKILNQFEISAPKSGMVIYYSSWEGKRKTGSQFDIWDPTIAMLPNLKTLISDTYINEVDISKIKINQKVEIAVDAFPNKTFEGIVTKVANMGEKNPNNDSKVFDITIKLQKIDTLLRPAMTSSNKILVGKFDKVLSIPLEAIHNKDSMVYVFKKSGFGFVKQLVKTGEVNDNAIIIQKGLNADDKVYLSTPENAEKLELKKYE